MAAVGAGEEANLELPGVPVCFTQTPAPLLAFHWRGPGTSEAFRCAICVFCLRPEFGQPEETAAAQGREGLSPVWAAEGPGVVVVCEGAETWT